MPMRKIVVIDEEKCTGCGLCIPSCEEGAIQIVDGKARLVKDIYCDGLGNCLGTCPEDAITIEEREAEEFDPVATEEHLERLARQQPAARPAASPCTGGPPPGAGGCPGSRMRFAGGPPAAETPTGQEAPSQLRTWPVQLTLVPPNAPYFQGADLLLVADCVPFAYADFHKRFLKGKPIAIACPKLDDAGAHARKLAEVIKASDVRSLTVVHMEVPCCFGLVQIARQALAASGKDIEYHDVTISIDGNVKAEA